MSGGFNPVIALACHRGARPVWSEAHGTFLAPEVAGLVPAGAAAGIAGLGDCLADGARAAERLGYPAAVFGAVEGGTRHRAGGTALGGRLSRRARPSSTSRTTSTCRI